MNILDESYSFLADHIAATDDKLVTMTLHAAATHAIRYGVTFPRLLFTSLAPESGKTHAMLINASLCANPSDASGTSYAFQNGLLEASNEPEKPVPTLYLDEVSDVFGQSGTAGSKHPVAEILRKGYKRGATRSASVNRVKTEYSVFTPFMMAGLRTAVPRDIRTRCIVITMEPGRPRCYYDVREAEPYAAALQAALASAVKSARRDIERFRGRGMHPKLVNRKLEIWEPLLAVAYAIGGQAWLTRAVRAFAAIALDESDAVPLTPRQQVTRDCAEIAEQSGDTFIGGLHLCDELARLENPLYEGRTAASLACLIRDSLPLDSEQRTHNGERMRGYPVVSLLAAWEAVRPPELAEVEVPEESNPFDVL